MYQRDPPHSSNSPNWYSTTFQKEDVIAVASCMMGDALTYADTAIGIPREVNEDMTINGYFFPKGTSKFKENADFLAHLVVAHCPFPYLVLLANYPQLHWSEEYFSQAHKFIPERWLPSESPFPPVIDKVFYPFSAGAKNCIGKGFAMMSLRLALAALVLNYDMERATPELDDDIFEASPGPDQGTCIIRMERRRKAPYIMRSDSGTSMTSI